VTCEDERLLLMAIGAEADRMAILAGVASERTNTTEEERAMWLVEAVIAAVLRAAARVAGNDVPPLPPLPGDPVEHPALWASENPIGEA
jgi:hypothetical protein